MNEKPTDIDSHRDKAGQKIVNLRRAQLERNQPVHASQTVRSEDIEQSFLDTPARSWSDVAAKVKYLLEIFSATPEAAQPRRKKLVSQVLKELNDLDSQGGDPDDPPCSESST